MGIYKCETFQKQGLRLSIEFVAFAGREVGGEEKKKKKIACASLLYTQKEQTSAATPRQKAQRLRWLRQRLRGPTAR